MVDNLETKFDPEKHIRRSKDIKTIERGKINKEGIGQYYIKPFLAQHLVSPAESIGIGRTYTRDEVSYHLHQYFDETFIFETRTKMKIEDKYYEFNKEDLVFLPRGTRHEIYSNGNEESILIYIKTPDIENDKVLC